jgi:hypothetical protein
LYHAKWPKSGRKLKVEFVESEREVELKQQLEQDVVVKVQQDDRSRLKSNYWN